MSLGLMHYWDNQCILITLENYEETKKKWRYQYLALIFNFMLHLVVYLTINLFNSMVNFLVGRMFLLSSVGTTMQELT